MNSEMSAGRGQFFQSYAEGLLRIPAQTTPGIRQPGRDRGKPFPGRRYWSPCQVQAGGWGNKRQPRASPSSVRGNNFSSPKPRTEWTKADFTEANTSALDANFFERLPSEILTKILSYLDASSLFCMGQVSKLLHQLANEDVVWHQIYMSEFGDQMWKPKSVVDAVPKVETEQVLGQSAGHWKRRYLRTMIGQEMDRWRRELRDINLFTGLPRQTEWFLRNLNVSWELTVCDGLGQQNTLEQSRAYFFKSSVIVWWDGSGFPRYHHITSIQLHGVRKETPKGPRVRKPGWRSLILEVDLKSSRFIGKDRLIKLMHMPPSFIVGIWRGHSSVAFIVASLHFHRLVEKSLLGSPFCPYFESVDLPPVHKSDPKFGLQGYTLHFVLHNTDSGIMLGRFRQLSCRTVQIQSGQLELKAISRTNLSQHRSLSGSIKLPWKSKSLEGSVENCCIMTLTLLDEFQKPFWCVSSPVGIRAAGNMLSYDYSGEHFLMEHQSSEGKVELKLVHLKEEQQFFLVSLVLYVPLLKVNKHFSTQY